MKQKLIKTMLLLCALIVGSGTAWAKSKVTDVANIKDGGHYFIGCTVSETDYYLYVNPTSSAKGQKKTTTEEATEFIFTSGTTGGWYIQIASSGKYITLPSSKDNAKVNVQDDPAEWEATNVSSLIQLRINGYLLQGNSGTSLNFGSYQSGQINVWLEEAGGDTPENEVTFSYEDYRGKGTKDYGSEYTMIETDVRITHNMFYCSDTYPQAFFYGYGGVTDGLITITPSNGATITKIEFITPETDYNGYQNGGEITASEGTVSANNEDKTQATITTWTGSVNSQLTITNTKTIAWSSIIVTYTGGLPRCATPVISGETPFVTYSTVSITCATEGATIQYCTSTDGVTYTDYQTYTAPFQISQSTTVKAQATKEGMVPSVAYKGFVQQDVAYNIRYFISDRAHSGTLEFIQLEDALVTYKNGNTAYLEDAYGAIMLYNCAGDLAAGDKINGYMHVTGYNPSYNGLPEITGFTLVDGYTKSAEPEVTPTVMTLEQLLGDPAASPYEMYLSKYIKIENATVTSAFASKNCTIEQGGYSIVLRDNGSATSTSLQVGDVVTVTGHVSIYIKDDVTTYQIAVYEQSQIVASAVPEVPTITVTPSSLTGFTYVEDNGPSAAQTITVSGTNLTADITLDMSTGKYEMSLNEADGYTNNLTLTQSAGEVAETTIYVRLKADMPVNASYSGDIVITSTDATPKYVNLSGSVTKPEAPNVTWDLSTDQTTTATTSEMTWTSSYASMAVEKGGASTNTNNYYPGTDGQNYTSTRFYKNSILTITPATGYAIASVVFTATTEGYASALANSSWTNATVSKDASVVTVTPKDGTAAISATIGGTCGFTSVKVYYDTSAPSTDPSIVVSTNKVEAPAAGIDGTIDVTYNNITTVAADIFFCDAEGKAAATYDWITANINSTTNNVEYLIEENTATEARTAYFKVWAYDDDFNEVYSELVTVTQAGYAVDYATLPFTWAGGASTDFVALNGVTTSGLGSDYNASNHSPYLMKFDSDDDYIQVKTDSQPGKVTIGVKMVGGSNTSTITVQESADGTAFTDVEELTISGDQNDVLELETTTDFAATSRYVRLTFTKGSNVGVGPITISTPVLPEFTWNLSLNSSIASSEDQVTWGSYYATMVADKAGSTVADISSQLGTYPGAYSRFWEKTKLTITPAKGYTIMSVEFLVKQTYHASYLKESSWTNATASADGTTVTIKPVDGTQPFFATISQNTDVETVKVIFSKDVTIDGCTTYVTIANTKFPSGVNAYIVSSVDSDNINLTKVTAVPERTAVILQATGTFATSIVDEADCDDVSANLLQPSMGTQNGDGSTIYALANGKHGIGFYLVDSSVTIPAGKAYLVISSSSVKPFYGLADEATGIKTIENEQLTIDNAAIYNLAGQRLQKMQKGINIVNGKKILK